MTRLAVLTTTQLKMTGKTMSEFASKLGINRTHLSAIVSGKSLPSLELAFALARKLGKRVDDLWEPTEVGIRARVAQNRRREGGELPDRV